MRELRGWDSVESYGKAGTLWGEDRRLGELGAEQNRELRGSQVPFSSEKPCIKETAALLIPKKAQMREERLKGLAGCLGRKGAYCPPTHTVLI